LSFLHNNACKNLLVQVSYFLGIGKWGNVKGIVNVFGAT